jgi:multiple sugar transport system substrate-binding protein
MVRSAQGAGGLARAAAVIVVAALGLVGCQGSASPRASTPSSAASEPGLASNAAGSAIPSVAADLSGEVTLMFNPGWEFQTEEDGNKFLANVKRDFAAAYPKATLKILPISGNLAATVEKMSLAFRNASTAPDVAQINVQYAGLFASSGFLLPLDQFLTPDDAPFWQGFPAEVKAHDTVDGKVYAIDEGENVSALFYNVPMLQKAGIALPWQPKTWADILDAARKVKAANPGVYPLWLHAGETGAAGAMAQGTGNLVYGSSTPTIYDTSTSKWVVDSPGLREVLDFYKTAYGEGLGVDPSIVLSPTANGAPPDLMSKEKLAITLGGGWMIPAWQLPGTGATWSNLGSELGVAPIPTVTGQEPGHASTLQAWASMVSKNTKNPALAWALIKVMMSEANQTFAANYAGFVPADKAVRSSPAYTGFAPHLDELSSYVEFAKSLPGNQPDYPVWFTALEQATGKIVDDPANASVEDLVSTMAQSVTSQLGPEKVQTVPSP